MAATDESVLYIGQTGTGDLASFWDLNPTPVEVLHVGARDGFSGVGVYTSIPNKEFTVVGEISATSDITNTGNVYTKALSAGGTISETGLLSSVAATFEGSVVEGIGGEATGIYSHVEGAYNKATGAYAHAEGGSITDPFSRNTASNTSSHAEGRGTWSDGLASHAEGMQTKALGLASHSEGLSCVALGDYSHAAGTSTFASGTRSYTTGQATSATATNTNAHGRFALADKSRAWVWQGTGTENLTFASTRADQFAIRPEGGFYVSGNVGINTDSIARALTVSGDISASGKINGSNVVTSDTSLVTSTPAPSAITNIIMLSQIAYNSLAPNYSPTTMYVIV